MKFSDMVIATASLVLIGFWIDAVLLVAFVPLKSNSMSDSLAYIIGFLVASLIVGYVFALKIQDESRIRAIGSIAVLFTFTEMLFLMVWFANPVTNPWFKDPLMSMFNTSGWTDYDWNAYSALLVTGDVVVALVVDFIGLYIGSMLRKPKKA